MLRDAPAALRRLFPSDKSEGSRQEKRNISVDGRLKPPDNLQFALPAGDPPTATCQEGVARLFLGFSE